MAVRPFNCGIGFLIVSVLTSVIGGRNPPSEVGTAAQTLVVKSRDEWIQAVQRSGPGSRIEVAPGTYRGGLDFRGLRGSPGRPIVIAAQDKSHLPVLSGGGSNLHLSSVEHLELHNLVLEDATGNGLNIDDGGSIDNPSRHVVLRGLKVRRVGPKGNRDGIKLSGVTSFRVVNCQLEAWGDSGSAIDMVGCHEGDIVGCTFKHRGDIPANGVQAKGGSSKITIQRCRFEHAGSRSVNLGGSTGADFFRPRDANCEAREIIVEDCTFVGSMSPIAFVGVDGATVRFNTIYRPTHWVIRILQETRGERFVPCRNGMFANNVIVFRADELRSLVNVGDGTAPETFRFAENHWYCADQTNSNRLTLPTHETGGSYGVDPKFVDESKNDLRLRPDSSVRQAGVRTSTPMQHD